MEGKKNDGYNSAKQSRKGGDHPVVGAVQDAIMQSLVVE